MLKKKRNPFVQHPKEYIEVMFFCWRRLKNVSKTCIMYSEEKGEQGCSILLLTVLQFYHHEEHLLLF